MVLYTITKHVTYWVAPRLLKVGVASRYRFFPNTTNYYWDCLCGLAVAQRLTSICVYEQSRGNNNRLQVLQDIVAPAISKVEQWKWNVRFLRWLRQELLVAKYEPNVKEAFDAYPQLRHSPQLTRHPTLHMLRNLARGNLDWQVDKNFKPLLPSTETILKAFQMRKWTIRKQSVVAVKSPKSDAPIIDLYDTAAGGSAGYVQHCGPFNAVCEEANIYQMWTKEYVERLGDYLMHQKPSIVLDVGAGDGLLIHFLKQHASKQKVGESIRWVATDDGSWSIFPKAQVERLSVEATLQKYASSDAVILCSWMPPGVDWTSTFRRHQVQEYILIGEADDGSCGNHDTWEDSLHEREGYRRQNLVDLLPFQFSRFDCSVSKIGMTISFQRRSK